MKREKLLITIALVVVATLVAVVSCKKETPSALLNNGAQQEKAFVVPDVDDMNAYLKDFKQRMQSSTRGDEETLSLDEAAWHLACLANVEFCRVNVEYNDVQFDTVNMQVNVMDGTVAMCDLNTAYEQMCNEIREFKRGFNHCDQNLYFINVFINGDGKARIALMTSFITDTRYLTDHTWYFEDEWDAVSVCDEYFFSDSVYDWDGLAASKLEYVLNLFDHHENVLLPDGSVSVSYIPTRNHTFDYTNTYDPYHSGYYNDSRVFAIRNTQPINYILDLSEMCYCLDSYLGLGYDYISDNLYTNEHPVCWEVRHKNLFYGWMSYQYHQLYVEYGRLIPSQPTPDD